MPVEHIICTTPASFPWAPISTMFAASAAFFIGYRQWRTSTHKLKLDLYEKRINLFNRAISTYQAIYDSDVAKSQQSLLSFANSIQSAKFLFRVKDKIFEDLNIIRTNIHYLVIISEERAKGKDADADLLKLLVSKHGNLHIEIPAQIEALAVKLHPYLSFDGVDTEHGPRFLRDYFWPQ